MAFKISINGVEVVCDSPEEAIALTLKIAGASGISKPQSPPKKPAVIQTVQPELPKFEPPASGGFDIEATVKAFLTTIRRANGEGADGETLGEALGLKHPKALGGRLALINKKVQADGFQPEDLFYVVRDASTGHQRRWHAGPKLGLYLDALDLDLE